MYMHALICSCLLFICILRVACISLHTMPTHWCAVVWGHTSCTQQCDWWTGSTLFHVLDNVEPPQRDPMDSFRMPIIDRYRDMGTIIMGKSEAGVVKKGDTLLIMPNRCEYDIENVHAFTHTS